MFLQLTLIIILSLPNLSKRIPRSHTDNVNTGSENGLISKPFPEQMLTKFYYAALHRQGLVSETSKLPA